MQTLQSTEKEYSSKEKEKLRKRTNNYKKIKKAKYKELKLNKIKIIKTHK
jgi:hypothetical protein